MVTRQKKEDIETIVLAVLIIVVLIICGTTGWRFIHLHHLP